MTKMEYGYVSVEDFEKIISVIPSRDFMYSVIFSIIRYRGVRPKHVAQLKLSDISKDFDILVKNTKVGRDSVQLLPELVKQRLKQYIDSNFHRFVNGYLFCLPNSKHDFVQTNTLCKKFRLYYKKAGLICLFGIDTNVKLLNAGRKLHQVRFYDLRASFGTDVELKYSDNFKTMVMLDHIDVRATARYKRRAVLVQQSSILNDLYS